MYLRIFATPLTLSSFIVVCFTGLCMLSGYHRGLVHPVHEMSSILFIVGSILHVAMNWKATLIHLKRPLGAGLAIFFAIVSGLALLPLEGELKDPRQVMDQAAEVILDVDLQGASVITRQSESEIINYLRQAGCSHIDQNSNLREIAQANKMNPMQILSAIFPKKTDTIRE